MSTVKTSVTLADIQTVVRKIVERFHPQRVILFGSYAYGAPHEGSDLDFLVVLSPPPSRKETWDAIYELRHLFSLPIQIVFMSLEEFEETKEVVGGLAYPAHQWGKVLYEADP